MLLVSRQFVACRLLEVSEDSVSCVLIACKIKNPAGFWERLSPEIDILPPYQKPKSTIPRRARTRLRAAKAAYVDYPPGSGHNARYQKLRERIARGVCQERIPNRPLIRTIHPDHERSTSRTKSLSACARRIESPISYPSKNTLPERAPHEMPFN